MTFFRSLRGKLLLVSLVLLAIPVLGWRFISDMDTFLREGQEAALFSSTRAIAATLSDRPALFAKVNDDPAAAASMERRKILALFGSSDPETVAGLGAAYAPSEEIERILDMVGRNASRIWVVDTQSRVRGLAGSLRPGAANAVAAREATPAPGAASNWPGWLDRLTQRWVQLPAANVHDDPARTARAVMGQVDRALIGVPTSFWRYTQDKRGVILSAAQPIWVNDEIVGAVVVEETTGAIQLLKLNALQNLLTITLIVFVAGFVTLLVFASRLAARVRRLGQQAETAIDAQGRIRCDIEPSPAGDEIGELSRSLSAVVRRLADYNHTLEAMAGRLSHELRTPVAVVRSSLDNLKLHAPDWDARGEARVYIERAGEGVNRLSALISRLSEATRLERFLQNAEREVFALDAVVEGCVAGYRLAYPEQAFELTVEAVGVRVRGVPDSIAQLLDKLVANAMDFRALGTAIEIGVGRQGRFAALRVANQGASLPGDLAATLFSSMVSVRPDEEGAREGRVGHLGLGLYIVRLIAEFHGGEARAENWKGAHGSGVRVTVLLEQIR